ncbi:MAG: transporter substrate-binding domain-containing protein [Halarcobacter sp.]
MDNFKWILLYCLIFNISLFSKDISFTKEEQEFIKNNPIITFSDVKWEPFAKIENGKYSGIFKEYYSILEKKTGLKFNFIKIGNGVNFQLVLDALKNKRIDMIDGSGKTLDRKSYAFFSKPLMRVNFSIVSKSTNRIDSLQKLKKSKIVVAKGSTASEYLKEKFPKKEFIFTDGIEDGLNLVSTNKADALVDNIVVLDHILENKFSSSILHIDIIEEENFDIYALVRDDYPLLKSILDKAILSISYEELLSINNKLLLATINNSKKITKLPYSKKELEYLSNRDSITMCIDPNGMPYDGIKNKSQIGINKDFIKMIENDINKKIRLVPTKTWSDSLNYFKAGKCEIISLIAATKLRNKYMNFTSPYLDSSITLATRSGSPSIVNISSLENKKIAIVKNYATYDIVKEIYPNLKIVEVETLNDGLIKIKDGNVFGVIDSLVSINYHLQKSFFSDIKINAILDKKLNLSFGVNKKDKLLFSILEKAVLGIKERDKQVIMNQWFNKDYKKEVYSEIFWKILAILFLLLLFLLYRHYETRRVNIDLKIKVDKELKKSREKDEIIFHQNKMVSMGQMLENIAHQWRQPLSQINSSVLVIDQALKTNNIKNKMINKKLDEIESMTNYMSNTIDDFKSFIKRNENSVEFNLLDSIKRSINIVEGAYTHSGIELELEAPNNIYLHGYPNDIQQALIVILNNARDAVLGDKIEKPKVTIMVKKDTDFVYIYIEDNAKGIKKEVLDKIFEPYFTTKPQTKGSGLGLYLSKKIIEESMQGDLQANNTNFGAQFIIKLRNKIE